MKYGSENRPWVRWLSLIKVCVFDLTLLIYLLFAKQSYGSECARYVCFYVSATQMSVPVYTPLYISNVYFILYKVMRVYLCYFPLRYSASLLYFLLHIFCRSPKNTQLFERNPQISKLFVSNSCFSSYFYG